MILLTQIVLGILLAYLALELALSWAPVLAVLSLSHRTPAAQVEAHKDLKHTPIICIVTACRDGAACIEGLVQSFRVQDYPTNRYRLFLVADNCTDNSAEVARSFGMEVYERHDIRTTGKGNALNEILTRRLHQEPFDVLVVLDIDARVEPTFLRRTAAYFRGGPLVLSCATFAKNTDPTLFTRTGTLIQTLIRLHQEGRAALGLGAVLYGSHGYALSREALDRLGWHTTTGLVTEDMELRLRSTLAGIPVRYAPDLPVYNDVTADAGSAREQRRRWNSIYLPLLIKYFGPLSLRALKGERDGLDALFSLLLFPAFANLFICLLFLTLGLVAAGWFIPALRVPAALAAILWLADIAYFLAVFRTAETPLGWREIRGFVAHLGIRTLALVEAIFFVHVKNWTPAPHEKDSPK